MLKKYKTLLLIVFIILLFSFQLIKAATLPLYGIIITIDPGHGGY